MKTEQIDLGFCNTWTVTRNSHAGTSYLRAENRSGVNVRVDGDDIDTLRREVVAAAKTAGVRAYEIDLFQLQDNAYGTACAKGWHDRPLRNEGVVDHDLVLAKLMLVHTELSEAWVAWQEDNKVLRIADDGKPEGFVVEVADTIVRMLDLCGALGVVLSHYISDKWPRVDCSVFLGHSDELHRARYLIDQAAEAVRHDDWRTFGCRLGEAVDKLTQLCIMARVDLPEALGVKMAYNKQRPHRHGGKKA